MARLFTAKDAKRLEAEHQRIIDQYYQLQQSEETLREDIKKAADLMVANEVLEVLKGVPIEEINRGKRGIKVKALRDHGFQTIADILPESVPQIASIYGISQDTAFTIKNIVNDLFREARKTTKIRISTDKKTVTATKLVSAIARYIQTQQLIDLSRQNTRENGNLIAQAIADLSPGKSSFWWIFTSNAAKQKSENAYQYLSELLTSEYGRESNEILQKASAAKNLTAEAAWSEFQNNSIRFFNILEDNAPGVLGTDDIVYGLPEELAREIQDEAFFPEGLLCELRRYQEWGVKYILHQEKVLLGDEMGLGKTVQAIASMVSLKNTGATHFVVVCPASVITNWCREIANKSKLRVTMVHGSGRSQALRSWIKAGGVAVTTYETTGFFKLDDEFCFSMLVVDEAHYIKNPDAKRSANVTKIAAKAERILFMTGTALENRVSEMISLIQILRPAIAAQVRGMEFLSAAPQFRQKVAPVYYRRKREDVLTELPEKIENQEWCTLQPEEEKVYEEAVLQKYYAGARRVSWSVDDLKNSSKATRMLEIIEEAEDDGRKIIVFSFFLDTLCKITEFLGERCLNPITGSLPPARRQEIIDEFEKAPAGTVLAAQIQSGGTGLNIQTASVVIICEPQFKPSIENQAISRAYRMGQTRNVLVYRLLCANTVDDKITELLKEKQDLFDAFADKSEAARESAELDNRTFGDIIQSEIDRIKAKKGYSETSAKNEPFNRQTEYSEQKTSKATTSFSSSQLHTETEANHRGGQSYETQKQRDAQMRINAIVQRMAEAKQEVPIYQRGLPAQEELRKGYHEIMKFMWQQEEPAVDSFGRRWVRCELCNRITLESEFVSYGGKNHVNLGFCRTCAEKMEWTVGKR